jgi:hypothetical protein
MTNRHLHRIVAISLLTYGALLTAPASAQSVFQYQQPWATRPLPESIQEAPPPDQNGQGARDDDSERSKQQEDMRNSLSNHQQVVTPRRQTPRDQPDEG